MLETMCAYTEFNMRGIAKLESLKMRDDQPIPRKHFVETGTVEGGFIIGPSQCGLRQQLSISPPFLDTKYVTIT